MTSKEKKRFERWIKAGPEILRAVDDESYDRARRLFQNTVLVELNSDGHIRVFGNRDIQVKIINRPSGSTVKIENRIEELIDSVLPPRYKKIYWPGPNLRKQGQWKSTNIRDVKHVVAELNCLDRLPGKCTRYDGRRKQLISMEA